MIVMPSVIQSLCSHSIKYNSTATITVVVFNNGKVKKTINFTLNDTRKLVSDCTKIHVNNTCYGLSSLSHSLHIN